jgi:hypothetical protein
MVVTLTFLLTSLFPALKTRREKLAAEIRE